MPSSPSQRAPLRARGFCEISEVRKGFGTTGSHLEYRIRLFLRREVANEEATDRDGKKWKPPAEDALLWLRYRQFASVEKALKKHNCLVNALPPKTMSMHGKSLKIAEQRKDALEDWLNDHLKAPTSMNQPELLQMLGYVESPGDATSQAAAASGSAAGSAAAAAATTPPSPPVKKVVIRDPSAPFVKGDEVLYVTRDGDQTPATIVGVHRETVPAYYTIIADGVERQTELTRLRWLDGSMATPAAAAASEASSSAAAPAPAAEEEDDDDAAAAVDVVDATAPAATEDAEPASDAVVEPAAEAAVEAEAEEAEAEPAPAPEADAVQS